jgi:hypothetical protein
VIPLVVGTPTRKLGRFLRAAKGVASNPDYPNIPGVMVTKDVTKLEGVVGIGIDEKAYRNVGVLATTTDSLLDLSIAMAHP